MVNMPYRRFGIMIDCSRNAVMNVSSLKRWIDLTTDMGYNTLLLYTEDTYEVEGNPYFGYGRGKYSKEELKEIDSYAAYKNMELIPCIQTLAHLNAIVEWPAYKDIVDCNDILLVGEEKLYALVDNMFKSLSECLRTKHINIGMDEAHMIGRGKYYDKHGDSNRSEILVKHIQKVAEIGKKYGLTLSMWSDMFFRLASKGKYYNSNFEITEDIKKLIPDNVELVYWDYYSRDKEHYGDMMNAHNRIKENTWFAGGFWTWCGFSPFNKFSMEATKAGLFACEKQGIKDVFFTMWGDDGGECSKFSALPAMFFAAEYAKGNKSMKVIKEKFRKKYNISFDAFMLVDLTSEGRIVNPNKYILYNDLFNGRVDTLITEKTALDFKKLSKRLAYLEKNEEYGYIFCTLKALSKLIALKADMGIRIRAAYQQGDKQALKIIIKDCKRLVKLYKDFYKKFRVQWMKDNKPHGFDIQDIRLGGMIARIEHCTQRLQNFLDGNEVVIEELEEELLDFNGNGKEYIKEDILLNSFRRTFSANILSW